MTDKQQAEERGGRSREKYLHYDLQRNINREGEVFQKVSDHSHISNFECILEFILLFLSIY